MERKKDKLSFSSSIPSPSEPSDGPHLLVQSTSQLEYLIPIGSIKKRLFSCVQATGDMYQQNFEVIGIDPHSTCASSVRDEEILLYEKQMKRKKIQNVSLGDAIIAVKLSSEFGI